jgi:lipopolysaccharide exporter
MTLGTTGAQVISIAVSPVLARLYEPSHFGVLATFMSVASIVGVFSTLRTERKIISEKDDSKAISFFFASIKVALFVSVISTLFVFVFIKFEFIVLKPTFLPLIFVFAFYYGVLQSANLYASRMSRFSLIVKSSFVRSLTVALFQIGLFFVLPGAWGIVLGTLIGLVLATFYLTVKVGDGVRTASWLSASKLAMDTVGYKKNAVYGGVQALSSTLSNNVPMILISTLGGYEQAGLYMMAERLVRIPINLITNNLRNVIAARIKAKRNTAHSFILRFSAILMLSGVTVIAAVFYLSDWFFVVFLGKNWMLSSDITKIMFIWVVFNWTSLAFQAFNMNFGVMRNLALLEFIFALLKIYSLVMIYNFGYGLLEASLVITIFSSMYCTSHLIVYFLHKSKNENLNL